MTYKFDAGICLNCDLFKARGAQVKIVDGRGNPSASVWFIGEAPGKQEEAQGEPFVGASGKILQSAIELIGLDEGSYFVTNVVLCRPSDAHGNNRPPTHAEKDVCCLHLKFQLKDFKPMLVVTLGSHALECFLGQSRSDNARITKITGTLIDQYFVNETYKVFVMMHPAATLYNPKLKDRWDRDVFRLKEIISSLVADRLSGGGGSADSS